MNESILKLKWEVKHEYRDKAFFFSLSTKVFLLSFIFAMCFSLFLSFFLFYDYISINKGTSKKNSNNSTRIATIIISMNDNDNN